MTIPQSKLNNDSDLQVLVSSANTSWSALDFLQVADALYENGGYRTYYDSAGLLPTADSDTEGMMTWTFTRTSPIVAESTLYVSNKSQWNPYFLKGNIPFGPNVVGNHSYDDEFGYLVAFLSLDTGWRTNTRTVRDFGLSGDGLTMTPNSIMSDADFTSVMAQATYISILVGSNGSENTAPSNAAYSHKGIVFTKQQVVTDPNVTAMSTTSALNMGREGIELGGYSMFWHDEDTGSGLSGSDYSFVGHFQGNLRDWGSSSKGYNNVSAVGSSAVTDTGREYTGDWLAVWMTNSSVAPVLS